MGKGISKPVVFNVAGTKEWTSAIIPRYQRLQSRWSTVSRSSKFSLDKPNRLIDRDRSQKSGTFEFGLKSPYAWCRTMTASVPRAPAK